MYRFAALTPCILSVVLVASCAAPPATSSGSTPVQAGAVDLAVWAVLGSGESLGGSNNKGCRATESDIRAAIAHLMSNQSLFGPSVQITWNSNLVSLITDSSIPSNRTRSAISFYDVNVASHFSLDKLNIYFAGNVQQDGNHLGTAGASTLDPRAADASSILPFVVVNDGLFDGVDSVPTHSLAYFTTGISDQSRNRMA